MQYDALLHDLAGALDRGDVAPRDVERLLRRARRAGRRPDVAGVLCALGVLVGVAGAAALLATLYTGLPPAGRLVVPFAFPAAAIAATLLLHRSGRPAWEVELAGMVSFVALGLAYLVVGADADAGSGYGMLASLSATAIVLALQRAIRAVRLTSWGLSASLVGFTACLADAASFTRPGDPLLYVAQAGVASLVGAALLRRGSVAGAAGSLRTAALLLAGGSTLGVLGAHGEASPWHVVLTVAMVGAFLVAALLDQPGLLWVGALAALAWLAALAALAGAFLWPLAAFVLGAGLLALGAVVARLRRTLPLAPRAADAQ